MLKGFQNQQSSRWKSKIAAVTMTTMMSKKVSLIISSECDHAELIGNHYFNIYGKTEKDRKSVSATPPPLFNDSLNDNCFSYQDTDAQNLLK